jgi:arylsulfatase A-like enzyme
MSFWRVTTRIAAVFGAALFMTSAAPAGAADPRPAGTTGASAADAPAGAPAASDARAPKPVAAVEHAVIISVDGLRPDVLLRAKTPNVRRLIESGSFTFWARTVPLSVTLPSHTSMLTGVTPERHGVLWNGDLPEPAYPLVPTIFQTVKRAGLTTALVTGKTKFVALERFGSVDWSHIAKAPDADVGAMAVSVLRKHRPGLTFVHFPGGDGAGHSKGWGSPEQIKAVEGIDRSIGLILDALEETGLRKSTVVILSADHGGAGKSHGPNDPRSRHIPWIASGPGIRRNYDLTLDSALTVNTEDTFATACFFLGVRPMIKIDGKPVEQVLEQRELMKEAKPAAAAAVTPEPAAQAAQ